MSGPLTGVRIVDVAGLGPGPFCHPHNAGRETFVEIAGVVQPAPAPRFSRTPGGVQRPPAHSGQHTAEILEELGLARGHLSRRRAS